MPFDKCGAHSGSPQLYLAYYGLVIYNNEHFRLESCGKETDRVYLVVKCSTDCQPACNIPTSKLMVYTKGVYNRWTGLVDWTGGLTLELIFLGVLRNLLIIHIMKLSISLVLCSKYNGYRL